MKYLYLVRHGETVYNQQHRVQGWCDSPLTDLGRYQALKAREYLKSNGGKIDKVYVSSVNRAIESAKIVVGDNIPIVIKDGLKELNYGDYEGKSTNELPNKPYNDYFLKYNGESEEQFKERFLKEIAEISKDNSENIMVVTHGGCVKLFKEMWEEYEKVDISEKLNNCCVLKYEYNERVYMLVDGYNKRVKI